MVVAPVALAQNQEQTVVKSVHLPTDILYCGAPAPQKNKISYSSAFSPIYGGNYNNGSLNNATTNGNWWSSTANNANNQYNLNYNNGSLNTNNNNKNNGNYVRCVRSS